MHPLYSEQVGEWAEPLMVTVNGKQYPTQLYQGVQRFVPDPAVEKLVALSLEHFGTYGRASGHFYHLIPAELKASPHANAAVRYMVEANEFRYCGLNEMAMALHSGRFTLDEWIEMNAIGGYSVGGFCDAVESQVSNLGLGEPYVDEEDGEEYEDYSKHFTIDNPLWSMPDEELEAALAPNYFSREKTEELVAAAVEELRAQERLSLSNIMAKVKAHGRQVDQKLAVEIARTHL